MARFKRILLKLSGESLAAGGFGIDVKRLQEYAQQIKEVHDMGVQIGIVIGGGNIFRGLSGASKGFDRVTKLPRASLFNSEKSPKASAYLTFDLSFSTSLASSPTFFALRVLF